ncbi:hypothetical protein MYCTH_2129707 [Thermothelomyces thermophilus ATCC 42464]|uniref:Uncharacterized protein n=1 Tax=Thermothelomyces thermophilus (strain ATCC 42464 / BCRC 31852 / DSM 1799) TaxID=573729 RepID=G2QKW7_THET4|nr:uncharacterized protein MYCTH_2129707 [Thermothelomyces thermophilus ATCC 42464]AEO60599.1 hypothetical protein MYCTH_2129707 [Thermothelomyces thermophilus ATCC 42464]
MAAQVPPDVLGTAVGVLVYSLICLISGFFLLWLVWVHEERKSYVAELNITGASTGLDLVLFYIQYYSYNVESLLVFFWAVELANSIFQLRITKIYRFHASLVAKAIAALLPVARMVLLRFSGIDKSTVAFMALADAISAKALYSWPSCVVIFIPASRSPPWNVGYARQQQSASGGAYGARYGRPVPKKTIYDDRWLVLRFSVAFCALSLFQIVVVNFQLRAAATNNRANIPPELDLSATRARGDFALFAPAPSAVLFAILVFATRPGTGAASCWGCPTWVALLVLPAAAVAGAGGREVMVLSWVSG